MPRKASIKCYFRCETEGPFHQFPKPENPQTEKFNDWKMVLSEEVKEKGDTYIYNNIRICDRHFKECYRSRSRRLTKNAVPTLHLHPSEFNVDGTPEVARNTETITQMDMTFPPESNTQADVSADVKMRNNISESSQPGPSNASSHIYQKIKIHQRVTHGSQRYAKEIRTLKAQVLKLRNKCKTLRENVQVATKLSQSKAFLKALEKLPEPAAIFAKMQLIKSAKKPRGRRFTMKEKILCLTILKQSPKAYNFLQRLFTLPSKRTIQRVLSSISLSPGLNDNVIKHLKKAAKKLSQEKKLCTLIFDEVALSPGMFYQKYNDEIIGFEDYGDKKTIKIADHALVFMLKSLKGKYKQPICFIFCQSATKKKELKKLIKEVINQVQPTGLKIVATVCDQSATNLAAIKELVKETKESYARKGEEYRSESFEINETKIFPIFDPPHNILKGIRNNLLSKDLKYVQNNEEKIAKWSHLRLLLDADVGEDEIRLVNKLTEAHVLKEKIPKMKVKNAAQVFSQRVSAAMRFLANHNILPKECLATADVLLLIDKLFDSFNGHSYQEGPKIYKCAMKKNSPHAKLWDEALPILNSMKFIAKKADGTETNIQVPSIKSFIHNIKATKELFRYLNENHNITSLLTRNINQDPIENFFCNIRSNGIRNTNPSCLQFIGAYKTILVNNLTSAHSVGANCEEDNCKILKPLDCLIKVMENSKDITEENSCINIDSLVSLFDSNNNTADSNKLINKEAKRYVAGYIVNKSIKICKGCVTCQMELLSTTPPTCNNYISERDYTKKSLKYPSDALCSFLDDIMKIIKTQFNEEPHEKNISKAVKDKINIFCNFSLLSCQRHKNRLYTNIISICINVIIHSWCKNVNRLLKGTLCHKDEINDNVKIQAVKYHSTHSHAKNKKR